MSRIGKHPVPVPGGVDVAIEGQEVRVKGKLGELQQTLPPAVSVALGDGGVVVAPRPDWDDGRAKWGLSRTLVANMVKGVTEGFTTELAISGVGYRAQVDGKILNLQLGYSHDIKVAIPADIDVKCPSPTSIVVSGADRQKVGQVAAVIRQFRKPEPYKGKGIRYVGERILRKEGKKK